VLESFRELVEEGITLMSSSSTITLTFSFHMKNIVMDNLAFWKVEGVKANEYKDVFTPSISAYWMSVYFQFALPVRRFPWNRATPSLAFLNLFAWIMKGLAKLVVKL